MLNSSSFSPSGTMINCTLRPPATASPPPTHPSSLFPQITKCRTLADLKQVHALMIKTGQIHDPLAAAELLRHCALSDRRRIPYALSIFRQMKQPNCFSWNTIIRALAESTDDPYGDSLEAIALFCEMLSDNSVEPNMFTYPSVLKAYSRAGRLEEGKQVHGLLVKNSLDADEFVVSNLVRMYVLCGTMDDAHRIFNLRHIQPQGGATERRQHGDIVMCNVMVDGYIRSGDITAARKLFDEMPSRTIVSWNVMISGYSQNGFFKEAIDMFHVMQSENFRPNYITLVSVLPAISRLGALELGKWIHLYAEKHKIVIDEVLGSAIVDMYTKCGSIEKALQVFESLPRRNSITWNAIIGGLAMHGRAKEALDYFTRMEESGVLPTDVAYISVLNACSHGGLVTEGRSIFNRMMSVVGFQPRIEHYGCMVDLLSRAGFLEEAEELILNMPLEPDDIIWKALLGACKIHKNIELGKRTAERLMKLAPSDSGSYVALSNMLASQGNWEAVSEIRLMMKEMDIRKDPGCSWIDIDGIIHEFLVEDRSHPQAQQIHLMLEEISTKLRSLGYVYNTSQVLLNVDEEAKECTLHHHSEKIAIAFGLISTAQRAPLRVVKNLRICDDCHASIKLISQVYGRQIVVRDRKRFHHFEDGSCSCGDYW